MWKSVRTTVAFAVLLAACKDDKPRSTTTKAPPRATPEAAMDASESGSTEPDMCELFFRAVDGLAACAKMSDINRDTFKKLAREVQQTTERPFGKGELAKCQMSLHMLRTDVKLDCPELAGSVPDVPIPM